MADEAGPAGAGERTDRDDTGWARLALVFALASFVETVGFGHYLSFLPLLVRELGLPESDVPTTVGLLSAAALLVGLPLVPFWGAWADRYSRKLIVVRSAVVEAVLFLALAFASDVAHLFLLVPLVGLVLGNTGVMLAELTDRTPRRRLGLAISLVGTSGPLGFAVGPALGGFFADQVGVRPLFLVDCALSAAAVLLLVVGYRELPDRVRSTARVLDLVVRSLRAVIRTPLARAVFLAYFCILLGQRLVQPFLALWIEDINGPARLATVVGLLAAGYGIAAAVGSPVAGFLSDRAGHARVFVLGVVASAICLVVSGLAAGLLVFAPAYAALGVAFATASSMLFTMLAVGLPTEVRSSVLNLALVPLYLSGVLGSLLSTALLAATGNDLRPLWLIAAVAVAAGLLPLLALRPRASRDAVASGPAH